MKTLHTIILFIICLTISAQQNATSHKGLPPSHRKLPNYDYVDSFSKKPKDNLALLIHNLHISLMAFHNNDSTIKSRPIVSVNGVHMPIQSLTNYTQSEVEKIEIEFMTELQLTALFGASAMNGYGIIKVQMKEKKE